MSLEKAGKLSPKEIRKSRQAGRAQEECRPCKFVVALGEAVFKASHVTHHGGP